MAYEDAPLAQVRHDLRDAVAEELNASGEEWVYDRALPFIDVPEAAATYRTLEREQYTKDYDDVRGPDGSYRDIVWSDAEASYSTKEYGLESPVDDNRAAQNHFDSERIAANIVMRKLKSKMEQRVAAATFNATTFTSYTGAVTTEWSNTASATPIADVLTAANAVRGQCGMRANKLLVSAKTWAKMGAITELKERVAGMGATDNPAVVSRQAVAAVMELDEIIVGGVVKDTGKPGADATISDVWDDEYALVYYQPSVASLYDMKLGGIIHWPGDGSTQGITLETYYDEKLRRMVVRGRWQYQVLIQHAWCGYLLSNIYS